MLVHLVTATGVLALLTIIPGPDMAVVTRRALVGGRADAVRAAGGVVLGLLVWGGLAVLGLTALLAASPTAYAIVKTLGVAYLVWLGVQALRCAGQLEALRDGREVPLVAGDQSRVGLGCESVGKVERARAQPVHVVSSLAPSMRVTHPIAPLAVVPSGVWPPPG